VRESVKDLAEGKAESYHAIIEELDMKGDDYDVVQACPSEFKFEGNRCVREDVTAFEYCSVCSCLSDTCYR